jgi:hypothetical protein
MTSLHKHLVQSFMLFIAAFACAAAYANPDIAKLAGMGSCAQCHADDKSPTKVTLNPIGLRYLGCQLDQACYNRLTTAVRTLQQTPTGPAATSMVQDQAVQPPAYVPPAASTATAAVPPRGSYQSRCRNIAISSTGKSLYAKCANQQNQTVYTRLANFTDCQSDIVADKDGYLACNLRGGGSSVRLRAIDFYNNSGWSSLSEVKMNLGENGTWKQWDDIGFGKFTIFPIGATMPCLVQVSYKYNGTQTNFTMNTCIYHKVSVNGAKFSFE